MYLHSQNLNERGNKVVGSKLWHGRAWFNFGAPYKGRQWHWEWCLGKHARQFHIGAWFGHGDGDDGITVMFCIPWILALYIGVDGVIRLKDECEFGIAIHSSAIWFKLLAYTMKSSSDDPWWRKTYSWYFPWSWDWWSTEILEHDNYNVRVVWSENAKTRKPFLDSYDERKQIQASVTKVYQYEYVLKNGQVQQRTAAVFVNRMTHRMKWWPLLPFHKRRTSIEVAFNDEVGERTGSWKGGCVGCGYDLMPGETPLTCLRRMERERKFK